jgi:hypothetical protein
VSVVALSLKIRQDGKQYNSNIVTWTK